MQLTLRFVCVCVASTGAAALALLSPAAATADPATVMATALRAESVPVVSVFLETPPPAEQPLSFSVDRPFTFEQYKPYLSPDFSAPLPIARVVVALPESAPLKGVVTTPGFERAPATSSDPLRIVWRVAIAAAAKRMVARGTALAGFQIDFREAGGGMRERMLVVVPSAAAFGAGAARVTETIPLAEVRREVEESLPIWARSARVGVEEDAGTERVVTVRLALSIHAFSTVHVPVLREKLSQVQARLMQGGGRIGRTIVEVTDASTGDPLYVAADDRTWGIRSTWKSPLVVGLESAAPTYVDDVAHTTPDPTVPSPSLPAVDAP